jgi:hypothetical protein
MRKEIKAVLRRLQEIAGNVKYFQLIAKSKTDDEGAERLEAEYDAIMTAIEALEKIE